MTRSVNVSVPYMDRCMRARVCLCMPLELFLLLQPHIKRLKVANTTPHIELLPGNTTAGMQGTYVTLYLVNE